MPSAWPSVVSLRTITWPGRPWVLVAGLCLLVFGLDLILVLTGVIVPADRRLALWFHATLGAGTDPFFAAVSNIAGGTVRLGLIAALVLGLLVTRRPLPALLVLLGSGGAAVLQSLIKILVRRPRPELYPRAIHADGYSFPSGHAADTLAFVAAVVFVVAWFGAPKPLVWATGLMGAAVTLLVGLSRITLGVHYPTDVLGGYLMAGAWSAVVLGVLPAWVEARQRSHVPAAA